MSDFKGSEYVTETFVGLAVTGQELTAKEFDGCTFRDCDFSDTIFNRCKFIECHFDKCNLTMVQFNHSSLNDISFVESKLIGVDWTKASWPNLIFHSPIKFYQCVLNDSSFLNLNLAEIIMEDCKARSVDFRDADLHGANFSYTDFSHSLFNKTNLVDADFTEASNYCIDIYQNDIQRAKFSRYEAVSLLESLDIELVD